MTAQELMDKLKQSKDLEQLLTDLKMECLRHHEAIHELWQQHLDDSMHRG